MGKYPGFSTKTGYTGTDDLPREGDLISYTTHTRGTVVLRVASAVDQGGYTDIYLAGCLGPPTFNINHATGFSNERYSNGGDWEIMERKTEPKPKRAVNDRCAVVAVDRKTGTASTLMVGDRVEVTGENVATSDYYILVVSL